MGGLDDLRARLLRETGDSTLDVVQGYGAGLWLARRVPSAEGGEVRSRVGALRLTADGTDLATGPLRKALTEEKRRAVAKAVREWRAATGKEGV